MGSILARRASAAGPFHRPPSSRLGAHQTSAERVRITPRPPLVAGRRLADLRCRRVSLRDAAYLVGMAGLSFLRHARAAKHFRLGLSHLCGKPLPRFVCMWLGRQALTFAFRRIPTASVPKPKVARHTRAGMAVGACPRLQSLREIYPALRTVLEPVRVRTPIEKQVSRSMRRLAVKGQSVFRSRSKRVVVGKSIFRSVSVLAWAGKWVF